MLKRLFIAVVLLGCFTLSPQALLAQSNFELSPFIGYRLGGELDNFDVNETFDFDESDSYGVVLDFRVAPGAYVEVLFSSQETELEQDSGLFFGDLPLFEIDVDYWHVGGLYQWELGQVIPYVVGTAGITELDPQVPGLSSETRPSIGFGGGVKIMFGDHFGVRLEGRGFTTFIDSDSETFCNNFGCYGFRDTDYLWQFEARGGLVFAF